MSKHFPLYVLQRRRQLTGEARPPNGFPFPVARGTPAGDGKEAGETFEETYSKHPFSELVRLGVACAGLIRIWHRDKP